MCDITASHLCVMTANSRARVVGVIVVFLLRHPISNRLSGLAGSRGWCSGRPGHVKVLAHPTPLRTFHGIVFHFTPIHVCLAFLGENVRPTLRKKNDVNGR